MSTKVKYIDHQNVILAILVVSLLLLVWVLGKTAGTSKIYAIPSIIEFDQSCETNNQQSEKVFKIFSYQKDTALDLLTIFCENQLIAKQFGVVRSFWGVSDAKSFEVVGKGLADLTLMKENMMVALKATETYHYQAIASYPDYPVYLISLSEKPAISKDYLMDKTVGLLEYPTSRSGHIVPMQLLSELGLGLDKMDIVYARNHQELRDLLSSGKVDVISSYWQEEDAQRFSHNYKAQIENSVSGSSWYLRMQTDNTLLRCEAQKLLQQYAKKQPSYYYSQLESIGDDACE